MSELEWTAPAKTWRVIKVEIIRITHAVPCVPKREREREREKRMCARGAPNASQCASDKIEIRDRSAGILQSTVGHAPSHDTRDPSLASQQVRRDPFGVLDALKETTIDGGCAEGCSGAEKKGDESDSRFGVELELEG